MTKLILPKPDSFDPSDYTKNKLVPLAEQLQMLCNEFFNPGSTAEEGIVDMMPSEPQKFFQGLDKRVKDKPKSVTFKTNPEIPVAKGEKRLKILLTATVFLQGPGTGVFQLVRDCDGMIVEDSIIQITNTEPQTFTRYLHFGNQEGRISPFEYEYVMQAKFLGKKCVPVCRRFALTETYI